MSKETISANELRIGNWVKAGVGVNPIQVFTIGYELREGSMINKSIPIEHIHPIPLSADILEKAGFELQNNLSYQLDVPLGFSLWGRGGAVNVYSENDNELGEPVKYLHQLQNLYFALTQTELTIKQPL